MTNGDEEEGKQKQRFFHRKHEIEDEDQDNRDGNGEDDGTVSLLQRSSKEKRKRYRQLRWGRLRDSLVDEERFSHHVQIKKSFLRAFLLTSLLVVSIISFQFGRFTCHRENDDSGSISTITIAAKENDAISTQENSADAGNGNSSKEDDKKSLPSSSSSSSFTMETLNAIRANANDLIKMLDDYYNMVGASYILEEAGWSIPWKWNRVDVNATNKQQQQQAQNQMSYHSSSGGDEEQHNDDDYVYTVKSREEKLVDTMMRALIDPNQDAFLIGVLGSSVAAGHDNCAYDNYENQLQRTLSPLWKAAGMSFVVQNAGEGGGCGDSHQNQVWCVTQNISPHVDIIHYSWSYFEVGDPNNGRIERESLVRWSQMMDHRPPVHIIHVGYDEREASYRCYGTDHDNAEKEMNLLRTYGSYGYNAFCMRTAVYSGWKDKAMAEIIFDRGHVGDGYHKTTRYGENELNRERKDSLGVFLRNWHPGPLGFQTVSDALSYVYTRAMLKALDRIEATMMNQHTGMLHGHITNHYSSKRPVVLKSDLPLPLECDPLYCRVNEPPSCRNYELPTYGQSKVLVANKHDEFNPHRNDKQNWYVWTRMIDKPSFMIPKLEQRLYGNDDPGFCQFDDNCRAVSAESPLTQLEDEEFLPPTPPTPSSSSLSDDVKSSSSDDDVEAKQEQDPGWIVFQLPKMEVGLVVICGCCSKEVANDMFITNEYLQVEYNGVTLRNDTWELYPNPKCVRLFRRDPKPIAKAGHSYLSLRLREGFKEPVRISHIITL